MGVRDLIRRRDPFAAVRADERNAAAGTLASGDFLEEVAVDVPGGAAIEVDLDEGAFVGAADGATTVRATLVADPFNSDVKTIYVHVDGVRVGKLRPHDAATYAPLVHELLWRNRVARCLGVVLNDGAQTIFGIALPSPTA